MKFEVKKSNTIKTVQVDLDLPKGYVPTLVKKRSKEGRYQFKVTVDTNILNADIGKLQKEIAKVLRTAFEDKSYCIFCQGKTDLNDTPNSDFQIYLDLTDENDPQIQANFDNNEYCTGYENFAIRYCPMCGRKLAPDVKED